ncbi:uncharacterized protein LOC128345065 isoform X2 [Hemicordylus capensis]|uniref:uncharacterized protein LOC128345065 isoform X2 n=1 Tax=Hemicordylus capensis TaxID=884348 RepID=UPI0023031ECC|nr:uncharacterized protein LOC128345065 isoform X2 [Hemicordylus capensis]
MQNLIYMRMRKRKKNNHKQIPWRKPLPLAVEKQKRNSNMSKKEQKNEEQRAAPLELVLPGFDLFQASQSAKESKKAKMEALAPGVAIPVMEPTKKWRKFPYSPQWVSILDVAQKILDEEDRVKRKQKQNKGKEEETKSDENTERGEVEIKEEPLSELCDSEAIQAIQPMTLGDLQPLLEQLPLPRTSHRRAEEEILTANEIEDIIQEIVAIRAQERLSEETTLPEGKEKMHSQSASSVDTQKLH